MSKYKAIFFDLDGTLLDTAPEFHTVINEMRLAKGLSSIELAPVRQCVSGGSRDLLKHCLGIEEHHVQFREHKDKLLTLYEQKLGQATVLIKGIETLIQALQPHFQLGIITNKPMRYAKPLLSQFATQQWSSCDLFGDSLERAKPNPDQLLHAAKLLQLSPSDCLYIGDAKNDIVAAQRANMDVVACSYGYIPDTENVEQWNANYILSHPMDLLKYLKLC